MPMTAVVFCMGGRGHVQRLRPIISGLAGAGVDTHVLTGLAFRADVERAGGRFIDLFAGRPLEGADRSSVPLPSRYVSFAGHYGDDVVREVALLRPAIVVHDTFAVIGVVVAYHLGIPRVNVCAGHNQAPGPTLESLGSDPRVNLSEDCWRAVRLLRERHGMPDATPFAYITTISRDLNLYCEPPEFLRPDEREPFQPIAFFGSLSPDEVAPDSMLPSVFGDSAHPSFRIYVSFGTAIWRYYETEALLAIEALSTALADRHEVTAVVSLGNRGPEERARRLARRNVRIESYVDQWSALREASVCLTHQGLNSTHEAIYHRTPMLSYPFFGDQPALSKRCQELGLAVALASAVRQPIDSDDIHWALARVVSCRESIEARLEEARRWELATISARPSVIARMVDLAR